MSTDTFLRNEEIVALTNRKVHSAQIRALKTMGIEHRVRPDGTVAILRNHITKVFDGVSDSPSKPRVTTPNWDAM